MRAFFFCLVAATVTAVPISSQGTVVETREDACPRDADGRSCAGRGLCSLGFLCVCEQGWAGEAWRLQVDALNLLDSDDHDIDYYYASRLPGEPTGGVEDIHFHVFEPRQFRVYLGYEF